MQMGMGMGMEMHQQMRASAALVALNSMLVLSALELQQLVQQELEQNPALDQADVPEQSCDICGRPLHDGICFACLQADHELYAADRMLTAGTERDNDPLLAVAAPLSALELIERDLRAAVPAADHAIVAYLIGSLDSHGFLDCSLEEVAYQLGVDLPRVEQVMRTLQDLGPPGIGARSMHECLLLQIERLDQRDPEVDLLHHVIANHWDDFAAHRYTELSRALGVPYAYVEQLRDLLRLRLQPYPLSSYEDASGQSESAAILPDVIITQESDCFHIEVAESRRYALRLNPLYQELARAVGRGGYEATPDEHEHLRSHVARARMFLKNMRHRRDTIRRITEYIAERQTDFLHHGIRHLQPLTRSEVAEAIGLHESTVSRATANKYVLLPSREVVPFSTFFHASLSVKDTLRELISNEGRPLTDEELVVVLEEHGYNVARRTVAKYRQQLGIPPSTLR